MESYQHSYEASPLIHVSTVLVDEEEGVLDEDDWPEGLGPEVTSTSNRSLMLPYDGNTIKARTKRLAGFALAAIGTALLVVCLLPKSSGGLLWANVEHATRFTTLPVGDGQISVNAPVDGTVAYISVNAGDEVSPGFEMAAIVTGSKIESVKAPGYSTVRDVLSVSAGDVIKAGEPLVVMDKLSDLQLEVKPGEKAVSADGWKGLGRLSEWGFPGLQAGSYLPKEATLATITGDADGTLVDVKMPEEGVLTSIQPLKPGAKINPGGALALYKAPLQGRELLSGDGLIQSTLSEGGSFKKWHKKVFDKIYTGDVIAEFVTGDGKIFKPTWGGQEGMVLDQQMPLSPGNGLRKGAELISVGQAVFIKHTVKVGDVVHKGDTVNIIQIGEDKKALPALRDGRVVGLEPIFIQDPIGFDRDIDGPFMVLGDHLPDEPDCSNCSKTENNDSKWLEFIKYNVSSGDQVETGDLVAVAQEVHKDDSKGSVKRFYADMDGYVTDLQPLEAGDMIGPGDDFFEISSKPPGGSFPWWMWFLLSCCCCLFLLLLLLCMRPAEQPAAAAAPVPVPVPVKKKEEPKPTPAPAPTPTQTPAPAAAPPPRPAAAPAGVPIYFDNTPHYFEYKPIGIKFNAVAPITIDSFIFNSYGKTKGLKIGQRLTRIKDTDVRSDHHYAKVDQQLINAIQPLPWWPLQIDFRVPNTNEVKTYKFVERPLGIIFTQHLPIKVEKFRPYALAQRKGVQAGWEIVRIAEEDTSQEGMAKIGITKNQAGYQHVDKHLLEGLDHLPLWPVKLEFKTPSGFQVVELDRKPLGITFAKKGTIHVEKVTPDTAAAKKGVQVGWTLTKIMDDHIDMDADHKKAEKEITEMMKHLP